MKYSALFDLDTTNLVFYALQRSMYENAVQVGGGYLVASDIRKSLQGKYCFSLAFVSDIVTPESITAWQICEYNEHHKIACETCEYFAAERICKAYGYIMERAAAMINGEEYASKWAQQWETAAKNAVLIVYNAVARDALQKALIVSEKDLTQAMQIEEYADIQAMQAEAQRIAKEYSTNQERSKDAQPEQAGAQPKGYSGIDPKTLEILNKQFFCSYAPVDMLEFAEKVVELTQQGDKGAQRSIFNVWRDSKKIRTIKKGGNIKPVIRWAHFRDEIAAACGVHFKHRYKPNELQ